MTMKLMWLALRIAAVGVTLALSSLGASTAFALTYNESIDGPLNGQTLPLDIGVNTITGTVDSVNNIIDVFWVRNVRIVSISVSYNNVSFTDILKGFGGTDLINIAP